MENRLTEKLIRVIEDLWVIELDARHKKERNIKELIAILQGGNDGFIAFNEESGFPTIEDWRDEITRSIFGIRVVITEDYTYTYIYTDAYSAEDMEDNPDGSFTEGWKKVSRLDWDNILECVKCYAGIND